MPVASPFASPAPSPAACPREASTPVGSQSSIPLKSIAQLSQHLLDNRSKEKKRRRGDDSSPDPLPPSPLADVQAAHESPQSPPPADLSPLNVEQVAWLGDSQREGESAGNKSGAKRIKLTAEAGVVSPKTDGTDESEGSSDESGGRMTQKE